MTTYEIAMCIDCAIIVANDDDSGMSESRARDIRNAIGGLFEENYLVIVGMAEEFFSYSPCDVCLSQYGGSRIDGALVPIA